MNKAIEKNLYLIRVLIGTDFEKWLIYFSPKVTGSCIFNLYKL